jgi:hypothetical protein
LDNEKEEARFEVLRLSLAAAAAQANQATPFFSTILGAAHFSAFEGGGVY